MSQSRLYIKNMLSERCKQLVNEELQAIGVFPVSVRIGEVELREPMTMEAYDQFKHSIARYGFWIVEDKKGMLIQRIKNVILQMLQTSEEAPKMKFSCYLSAALNHDYTYLANVFSEHEGMTIEQFVILNRIERAKDMILRDELTLTEIAYRLKYSSVAHLSNQFKKITGFPPSIFRLKGMKSDVSVAV